jgi:hypothetical protein
LWSAMKAASGKSTRISYRNRSASFNRHYFISMFAD